MYPLLAVMAYAGPPETTNCGDAIFHDWHLEIFENPSEHAHRRGFDRRVFQQERVSSSLALDGVGNSPDNKN